MRRTLVMVALFVLASSVLGKNWEWKDAKVAKISSESGGALAMPVGTAAVAVPIIKTYYWIETADLIYVLGPKLGKHHLNVTLYGKTKIAIDGHNAHILDDDGKDQKLPIVQKIARTEEPSPKQ